MIEPGKKWSIDDHVSGDQVLTTLAGQYGASGDTPSIPEASVHIYRLAEGTKDSQSPHEQDEFYLVLEGQRTLTITVNGKTKRVPLAPHDLVYVPKNTEHRFTGNERFVTLVIFVPAFTGPAQPPEIGTIQSRDEQTAMKRNPARKK